ncbi:fibrinogen-like protein 1 [Branchiostoma floridae x Branchiostoma japonicum]
MELVITIVVLLCASVRAQDQGAGDVPPGYSPPVTTGERVPTEPTLNNRTKVGKPSEERSPDDSAANDRQVAALQRGILNRRLSRLEGQLQVMQNSILGSPMLQELVQQREDVEVQMSDQQAAIDSLQFQADGLLQRLSSLEILVNRINRNQEKFETYVTKLVDQMKAVLPGKLVRDSGLNGNAQHQEMPRDCAEVYTGGNHTSGVYDIRPHGQQTDMPHSGQGAPFSVYCRARHRRGWTVIQRRQDGTVNFTRSWTDYKNGFGDLGGEFWLGNDKIHAITAQKNYTLRIDMSDWEGNKAYAEYDHFAIDNEWQGYRLRVSGYSGTAGESMYANHDSAFSTRDKGSENQGWVDCPKEMKGGWWYTQCGDSNLNGLYHRQGEHEARPDGMFWWWWKRDWYSLKSVEMAVFPHYYPVF